MEKSMQRISLLLTILLFGGIFTMYSQKEIIRNNIRYKLDESNGTALLYNAIGVDISGDLILTENINYDGKNYILESINSYALMGCFKLTSVKLPKTIKHIGKMAFNGCFDLQMLDFSDCELLDDIGGGIFTFCDNLIDIKCNSNFFVEDEFLYSKDKKRLISYFGKPKGNISIHNGVEVIDEYAFYSSGFISVKFPSSLQKIKEYAFFGALLSRVDFSEAISLKSIEGSAFQGCNIVDLLLPESLEFIGKRAFSNIWNLKTVDFSKCVFLANIGGGVFTNCTTINKVKCNSNFRVDNNILYSNDKKHLISSVGEIKGEIIIPDGVVTIENDAFNYYNELTSVKFPRSLVSIGNYAFDGCRELIKVDFADCSLLENIGSSAFGNCYFTNLDFYKCVFLRTIGRSAFRGCKFSTVDLSGCISLLKIDDDAFEINDDLHTLILPSSLLELGVNAFWKCESLYNVDLSRCSSLREIKEQAFSENKSLEKFDFSKCNSLTSIGGGIFSKCNNLSEVICNQNFIVEDKILYTKGKRILINNFEDRKEIKLPKELESIANCSFKECLLLQNMDLSDCTNLKRIEKNAFEYCMGLKSIKFPPNLEVVENYAFCDCEGLTFVQLPASLIRIHLWAFGLCNQLNEILFLGTKEPEFVGDSFYLGGESIHRTVYIPYAFSGFNASNWGDNVTLKYGQWPAGNKDIEFGDGIKVYGGKGSIKLVVSSSGTESFSIFNPNGIEIYSGITEGELRIPVSASGMYIIRIGQQSWKVGVN